MPVGIPLLSLAPWRGWVQIHMLWVPSEDPTHYNAFWELSDNLRKINGNVIIFHKISCIFTLWAAIFNISRSLRSQI